MWLADALFRAGASAVAGTRAALASPIAHKVALSGEKLAGAIGEGALFSLGAEKIGAGEYQWWKWQYSIADGLSEVAGWSNLSKTKRFIGASTAIAGASSVPATVLFTDQSLSESVSSELGAGTAVSIGFGMMPGMTGIVGSYASASLGYSAGGFFGGIAAGAAAGLAGKGVIRTLGTAGMVGAGAAIGGPLGASIGGGVAYLTGGRRALAGIASVGAAGAVAYGGYSLLKAGYRKAQMRRQINTSGDLSASMTERAISQRQRAVQAMREHGMSVRSAIGQEASYLYQRRNLFSSYRMF